MLSKSLSLLLASLALAACFRTDGPGVPDPLADTGGAPLAQPGPGLPTELPVQDPAGGDEEGEPLSPAAFGPVDHPYFPVLPGMVWTYEGTYEGAHRRDVVRVLPGTRLVMGVACSALYQELFLDGVLVEQTTEWFAGDEDGNLWKFGEASYDLVDGRAVLTDDSWEAGVDGAVPWMFLKADPRPGDVTTNGDEIVQVLSVSAIAVVPAGEFRDCLEAVENPDDEDDKDVIIYAPGTGLVSEDSPSGKLELVSLGTG